MTVEIGEGWTPEGWAAFWNAPDPAIARKRIPAICVADVVGYWPRQQPVRGNAAYLQRIVQLLTLVPDLHVKLEEHATNGEFTFVRWTGRGTGPDGPFEITGVDRVHVRNGRVIENRIFSDAGIFAHFARMVTASARDDVAVGVR